MPDYSKGCVYMIKNQNDYDNENVYIGSCCNFSRRKCEHKRRCNNPIYRDYNLKVYQYIRENDGWDYWIMTKIIDYPCNSKSELNTMERKYIDQYKATLNGCIPTRTKAEYYQDNHETIAEKKKQYQIENREKLLENMKQYRIDNKDKILEQKKQYYIDNKDKILEQKKQYHIDNHDKLAEKNKQYQIENREKILEQKKQKVKCDICGCESTKGNLLKHKRTKKCINFVKN
jgi:hypothetical protein